LQTIGDVRLGPSAIHGRGVFTTRPRAPGELLTMLDGQLVSAGCSEHVLWELEWNAVSATLLLVRALRTTYGFINHALEANLTIGPDRRTLRSSRAVQAGEELTLNYLEQPLPPAYLNDRRSAYLNV
jgi:hypothetical protein